MELYYAKEGRRKGFTKQKPDKLHLTDLTLSTDEIAQCQALSTRPAGVYTLADFLCLFKESPIVGFDASKESNKEIRQRVDGALERPACEYRNKNRFGLERANIMK